MPVTDSPTNYCPDCDANTAAGESHKVGCTYSDPVPEWNEKEQDWMIASGKEP